MDHSLYLQSETESGEMGLWEIFLIAVGLSMDAFAVSIGKGLSVKKTTLRQALCVGIWFGGFQALMPLAGWLAGSAFANFVQSVDHWIAFGLLALIGANMIREALSKKEEKQSSDFGFRTMLLLAIATSIDALAAGVSFAFLDTSIWTAIAIIGATTFAFSVVGLRIGNLVGSRFHKGAGIFGGCVLIAMGIKILVEHLFFQ